MKKILTGIILLLTLAFFAGCASMQRVDAESWSMDTRITISVFYNGRTWGSEARRHQQIADDAAALAYMFDLLFDRFNPESDISRINHARGEYVEVNQHTINILEYALYFREMTGGRFDVTIGAVMDLWDFGFYTEGHVPARADIERALEGVGTGIYISGNRVRLGHPEARLDLGAIAKGYAADYVADYLRTHDVAAIVNFWGDIALVGDRPDGELWGVGISNPFSSMVFDDNLFGLFVTGETAVVTSGTTARDFMAGGLHFHHIMDVDTGFPVQTPFASVSVVAENTLWGEMLTSAFYTMHHEDFSEMLDTLENVFIAAIDWHGNPIVSAGIGPFGHPDTIIPMAWYGEIPSGN